MPGVVAVLTAADLPLAGGSGRAAEPLAREEIVWSGQPVALVIAESEAAAEDGAALVDVDAEPLPAVLDLEAALAAGAPPARVTRDGGRGRERRGRAHRAARGRRAARPPAPRRPRTLREPSSDGDSPNVAVRQRIRGGDAAAGLERADAVVSGRFRTSWVHQAYLEPQSALAWVEPDGELVVHSSTQGAFMAREGLANTLGLPIDRVRVQAGADRRRVRRQADDLRAAGGRRRAQAPAARADRVRPPRGLRGRQPGARRADRPRARRDRATATLTAIRGRVVGDRGGLGDMGVEAISTMLSAGPYRWPAHDLTALGVATNRGQPGRLPRARARRRRRSRSRR